MIPTEKSYHSPVKEQLYIKQGSWKKSKRERRICQGRQTHFCGGRWPVFHKEFGAFAAFQNSLHASRWLPKKAPEVLWSGCTSLWKQEGKIAEIGQCLTEVPTVPLTPASSQGPVPEITVWVWAVMGWNGRAGLSRSNQLLSSACLLWCVAEIGEN